MHQRHRAKGIETQAKVDNLRHFIEPVKASWQEPQIRASLSSYNGFCESLGLDKAQQYLVKHNAHRIADWGSVQLDDDGLALQNEMEARLKVSLRVKFVL